MGITRERLEDLAGPPKVNYFAMDVRSMAQELIQRRRKDSDHLAAITAKDEEIRELREALTRPVTTDEATSMGLGDCEDPDTIKAIEQIYANRALRKD